MQRRYSTVSEDEQRAGMGRMLNLVAFRATCRVVDEKGDEEGAEVDETGAAEGEKRKAS
jgi:hypothetical protein